MSPTDEEIAQRIVDLREQRGWSQGELAAALRARGLNWSQGTLSRVEAGARPVRLAETGPLLEVLNTSLTNFVDTAAPVERVTPTWRSELYDQWVAVNKAANDLYLVRARADQIGADLADAHESLSRILDQEIEEQ